MRRRMMRRPLTWFGAVLGAACLLFGGLADQQYPCQGRPTEILRLQHHGLVGGGTRDRVDRPGSPGPDCPGRSSDVRP